MKQTISNACGTVAMMHAVANSLDRIELSDGALKTFLEETKNLDPAEKAKMLENNDSVCEIHDTVAKEGQTAVRS
jgi:ubiquitin carboxyl-terminal hydrolase L3